LVVTPVHFFSHGSTMMLGEETKSADYWKSAGDAAIANNVKGIVIMGAHWDCKGDQAVRVAMNPSPEKQPVAMVHPSKYQRYKLNPDLSTGKRCIEMLQAADVAASAHETFVWVHDVFLILIRMFPDATTCPPTTIISSNAHYDPHFHTRIGAALRPLRAENYLLIGSGGAVHNLYRNEWRPMLAYRDNLAQERPPGDWAMEFRQAFKDVVERNSGPKLRRGLARLMKHPQYREAHATDDHFIPACFVAGLAGDVQDENVYGKLMAEDWELTNMCSTYTFVAHRSMTELNTSQIRNTRGAPIAIPSKRRKSRLEWSVDCLIYDSVGRSHSTCMSNSLVGVQRLRANGSTLRSVCARRSPGTSMPLS
jgi:aromatic ring-opening dioxygenase catalytic subunit (LigB family)